MTISGSYSYSPTVAFTATATVRSTTERAGTAAPGEPNVTPLSTPAASEASATEPARTPSRATTLFEALDTDRDGSVTESEFTRGALALLRNAGANRRLRHGDGEDEPERGVRRARGLERRLEQLFTRVDANQDGRVEVNELVTPAETLGSLAAQAADTPQQTISARG
jgi:hypothetical protein